MATTCAVQDVVTGDVLDVHLACVQLRVVTAKSLQDGSDEDFRCPITQNRMEDPVRCSDGKTYERRAILRVLGSSKISPCTRQVLDPLDVVPNQEMLLKIQDLNQRTQAEEEKRRRDVEGAEERQLLLKRLGYPGDPGAGSGELKESLDLMEWLQKEKHGSGVCIYGAPASGKTVSMMQITMKAVQICMWRSEASEELSYLEGGCSVDFPLVPLFIRAAQLSKLLEMPGAPLDGDLVQFFIARDPDVLSIQGAEELLSELYSCGQLLVLIDGLDEGGGHRVKIENFVAKLLQQCDELATSGASALVVSTREKNFAESVSQNRLTTFARAQIQPLDGSGRRKLIRSRLHDAARLEEVVDKLESMEVPDIINSPFLLSLLVNVFNETGTFPSRRDQLYREAVLWVLRRAADREPRSELAQSLGTAELVKVGFEFLECLGFVCHMDLKRRDFLLADERLGAGLAREWHNERVPLEQIQSWVFDGEGLALLCCTDTKEKNYRFGHLTVQEFLASSFLVRLSTSDNLLREWIEPVRDTWFHEVLRGVSAMIDTEVFSGSDKPLREWIKPVCDSWFHEVLRLASTMMDADVFIKFSLFVLEQEDGSGAFCEVASDMIKERCASLLVRRSLASRSERENVERDAQRVTVVQEAMMNKVLSIRPFEAIVTMLSHPSAELRALTLSEISKFPFLADVGVLSGRLLDSVEAGEATTAVTTTWMCSALLSVCQLDLPSDEVESVFRRTLQIAIGQTVTAFFNVLHEAAVTAVATFFKRFGSEHEGFIDVVTDLLDSQRVKEARRKVLMQIVFDLRLVHERLVELVLASWLVQPFFDGMDTTFSDWLLQIPRPTNARISALLLDMEEAGEVRADLEEEAPNVSGTSEAVDASGKRAGGDADGAEAARVVVERDFRAGLVDLDEQMAQDVPEGQFAPLWKKMFNSMEHFADEESGQLFQCVFKLDFPGLKIGSPGWDAEVTRTWRLLNLGRWAFSAILQHVRDSCKAELLRGGSAVLGVSSTAIAAAAKEVCMQQRGGTSYLKVEAELLLKELGIGRRAREIDAWSGAVSAVKVVDGGESEKLMKNRAVLLTVAAQSEARWLDLVSHLEHHGLYGLADRLRDDKRLGVRSVFQLGDLTASDLEVIEWLSVVERRTLVRICQVAKREFAEKHEWLDLCSFLNRHGVYEIAERLRSELGVHSRQDLAYVRDEDLHWLPVVKRRIFVDICRKIEEDTMSPGSVSDGGEGSVGEGGSVFSSMAEEEASAGEKNVESVPDFGEDHVQRFLRQLESNPSTVKVVGFQEYPNNGGGKLHGEDREVARQYWLQLSEDALRFVRPEAVHREYCNLVALHVGYRDKWLPKEKLPPMQSGRDHGTIKQMDLRFAIGGKSSARPANAFWSKCVDLDVWFAMRGKSICKIPPEGWQWRENASFSPRMHALLVSADQCKKKLR